MSSQKRLAGFDDLFCECENGLPQPLVIAFSGGRTSGYMLRTCLDFIEGQSDFKFVVCFQNTGLELPQTLDFVQRCSEEWKVEIHWIERDNREPHLIRVVNHNSASRHGEPFAQLFTETVDKRRDGSSGLRPLPNPAQRVCTSELKTKLADRYVRKILDWENGYYKAVGLRADESKRVEKQRRANGDKRDPWINIHPLYDAGVTQQDITSFWARQPFDLGLDPEMGNCDLCFLKSAEKIKRQIVRFPARADFWIELEETVRDRSSLFRIDRPCYRDLKESALRGDVGFERENTFLNDCSCTD